MEQLALEVARHAASGIRSIALVVGKRKSPGLRVRLIASNIGRCPMGEVVCVNADGNVVALFNVMDVLAFLTAHGYVKMIGEPLPEEGR